MSEFDRDRVALVEAKPPGDAGQSGLSTGTGYFLTGDLVLTAGHIAGREGWEFSVRAEGDGPEESRWQSAEPCWTGSEGTDAILLRTEAPVGDWEPPAFIPVEGDGTWISAGYAKAAVDAKRDNRKTLPLKGGVDLSRGQGFPELALVTNLINAGRPDDDWSGVSGAPVFTTGSGEDDGLIGIVIDASRANDNHLVGLPVAQLLEDVRFRLVLHRSFLGSLPTKPYCLVLTSESWDAPNHPLMGKVADVLEGFRDEPEFARLHPKPIEVPVLTAVESVENFVATVDALARADYVIADVTGFEPAVMLLLGIRSVVRRGVTISVVEGDPVALAAGVPFNVRETRVLSFTKSKIYERLHQAMTEGAANLRQDSNYLDLPAYQAVRMPRPRQWAEDDKKNLLILCSFGDEYSKYYDKELSDIISGRTRNKTLLRMMDLTSPRLVGQALYEQIRWCSRCLVDWTGWRPNVFFELGVRLACSEHEPLCIIQSDDEAGPRDEPHRIPMEQYSLLRRLLEPVVYDKADPRKTLNAALEPWSREELPPEGEKRPRPQSALPPGATFVMAQEGFAWREDDMLVAPHYGQREAAERIFGQDPGRQPQRLVLFADNGQFEEALLAAGKEKWIATWLYMKHLYDAQEGNTEELVQVASMIEYALKSPKNAPNARHEKLREEIQNFRKAVPRRPRSRGNDNSDGRLCPRPGARAEGGCQERERRRCLAAG